jgi:SecD/SecF fusion protein
MRSIFPDTHVDFMGKSKLAVIASVALIVIGMVGMVARGRQILDIDFLGGTSVTMILQEPSTESEIRRVLEPRFAQVSVEGSSVQYSVNRVDVQGLPEMTVWKVDSSIPEVEQLENILYDSFALAKYSMDFGDLQVTWEEEPGVEREPEDVSAGVKPETPSKEEAPAPKEEAPAPEGSRSGENQSDPDGDQASGSIRTDWWSFVSSQRGGLLLALADEEAAPDAKPEPAESSEAPSDAQSPSNEPTAEPDESNADESLPSETVDPPQQAPADEPTADEPTRRVVTRGRLTFGYEINGRTLQDQVMQASEAEGSRWAEEDFELAPEPPDPDWMIDDSRGFRQWSIAINADEAHVRQVLQAVQNKMAATPVWPSSNEIGGKVAGDTQALAVAALLASLAGIILYIWIRFQRVIYGLAAVVALIHDVLIMLGAIALSYWLGGILGFLQVQEFKISLSVVAAILTIIGYSLNDTIVIFDRVREVKGKSPNLTSDILNTSLNQTLSRTLLTSFTTFLVVAILYFFGGAGVHDFAYCLVIGVVVGTYSSIYIASPMLLWMSGQPAAAK